MYVCMYVRMHICMGAGGSFRMVVDGSDEIVVVVSCWFAMTFG